MTEIVKNNKKIVIEYLKGSEIVFVFNYNKNVYFYKPGTSFKVTTENITDNYLNGILFVKEKYFYYQDRCNSVIIDNIVYGQLDHTVVRDILFLVNGLSSLVHKSNIVEIEKMINSALIENKNKGEI